jgi:hypothetical protein
LREDLISVMAPRKKLEAQLSVRRKQQQSAIEEAIRILAGKLESLQQNTQRLDLLESVSLGLYDELDKLAKKAGAEEVTDLVLEQVNDVIREVKELIQEDPYVQRYREFVPAGNNPQHRDVVVVLRQIRQALDRFASTLEPKRNGLKALLSDARGVRIAIMFSLEGQQIVTQDDLRLNKASVGDEWMTTDAFPPEFNFDRLDEADISKYFSGD